MLLELTSILANAGGIDPNSIEGYPELQNQVEANTADITTLESQIGGQGADITTLQLQVIALTNGLAVVSGSVTTLAARNQVYNGVADPGAGLGVNGDWYARTDGPNRAVWTKVGGTWARVTALF